MHSRSEVFCKKGVLRNFAKLTGKQLCQSVLIKKETPKQVFSSEFCGISYNTFPYRKPHVAPSEVSGTKLFDVPSKILHANFEYSK